MWPKTARRGRIRCDRVDLLPIPIELLSYPIFTQPDAAEDFKTASVIFVERYPSSNVGNPSGFAAPLTVAYVSFMNASKQSPQPCACPPGKIVKRLASGEP